MSDKKIEQFWRNATAEDIARVMKGETVDARFRDSAVRDWKIGHLNGWADGEFRCDLANCWVHCQVYEPPEWYTNKPDPGEGYRLLEKFPDELKLATDEAWNWDDSEWQSIRRGGDQECETWYRRRIEPVEPTLLGHYVLQVGDLVTLPNGQTISITAKGFKVY
jgi:hypothetical protein